MENLDGRIHGLGLGGTLKPGIIGRPAFRQSPNGYLENVPPLTRIQQLEYMVNPLVRKPPVAQVSTLFAPVLMVRLRLREPHLIRHNSDKILHPDVKL